MKPDVSFHSASLAQSDYTIWHQCFAHPSKEVLNKIVLSTKGFSDKLEIPKHEPLCNGCLHGKMHADPFKTLVKRALKVNELIHVDLMELPVMSYHRYKWVFACFDDYSSYGTIFFLHHKSETLDQFKEFVAYCKLHKCPIKNFRSD